MTTALLHPPGVSSPSSTAEPVLVSRSTEPFQSKHAAWNADISVRLSWVRRFRGLIVQDAANLESLITRDIAKTAWEAFSADLLPLLAACRWHERNASGLLRERRTGGRPFWMLGPTHRECRMPLGRVAIIATWNYPVQLLGIQVLQALVAGNLVSVKPSENAPASQSRLLELAQAAGLPDGVLEVWPATRDAGPAMLAARRYDHIVFTGSTSVGRAVAEHAATRLTPTTLELSGHDSAIVLDDADAALAAQCIWAGVAMNAGQTCMAPRRAIVHTSVYRQFVAALAPLASGAARATLISEQAAQRGFELAQAAVRDGGRSLSGVLESPAGRHLRPLAIADCPPDSELMRGEHFAPVLAIAPFESEAEALALHGLGGQHLSTSVFSRDPHRVDSLMPRLNSSCVTINDTIVPTAHPATSIAGAGLSGWGASRGKAGLLAMTRAVSVSTTSSRLRLPPEPPPAAVSGRLRRIMLWWYRDAASPTPPEQRQPHSAAIPSESRVPTSKPEHALASNR